MLLFFPTSVLPGPLLENALQVNGGFLQHILLVVGIDVGSGLVVCVTDDFHGDQRVDGRTGRESLRQDERGRHVGETTRHPFKVPHDAED